ncbi:MAG TPA: hypothetical protein PKA77_17790, partial [Chitinophagaceae bacterium]|nr:hypothetical protein [Chitinophagaceae bacterium]
QKANHRKHRFRHRGKAGLTAGSVTSFYKADASLLRRSPLDKRSITVDDLKNTTENGVLQTD